MTRGMGWLWAAVVLWVPGIAAAQASADDLEVAIVTFGPGPLSWERFAHNAIWIRQPSRGIDVLYNYGIFDATRSDFIPRFIQGRMLYRVAGQPPGIIEAYIRVHRSVWVQELNLTAAQRIELRDFLLDNVRPERRDYRYHYYYDNCSTRVRDALDLVLDGALRRQFGAVPSGTTYRFHTQRLTAADPLLYTGLLIGLANPVDDPISVWEEMFLPMELQRYLRDVTVVDDEGNAVPLVRRETTLHEDHRYDGAAAPPRWLLAYLSIGLAVAGGIWLTRGSRIGLAVVGMTWTLLTGLGGSVLAFLWLFTDHNTSYWNENLFFLNPLALGLLLLLPWKAPVGTWVWRWRRGLALTLAALGALGFAVQVLPGFDQVNGQVIALILPANLMLAWGVTRRQTVVSTA